LGCCDSGSHVSEADIPTNGGVKWGLGYGERCASPEIVWELIMFAQFRAQYPTGSLTSELLSMEAGTYVVRVQIQVGTVTLATGMAEAKSLEMAEDRARLRALEALGMPVCPPSGPTQVAHDMPPPWMTPQANLASLPAHPTPTLEGYPETPMSSDQDVAETTQSDPDSHPFSLEVAPPPPTTSSPLPVPEPSRDQGSGQQQPAEAPPKPQPEPAATPPQVHEPVDLSDILAQTTVEMKRMGWTDAQGRDYLERTYNKKSRHRLTDEELLEFLAYLEAQPTSGQAPF